ncbi:MAG: F0F1 ATP synthase subunit delta, partial [Candidatus Eisenbacteria bacterium]|nr:F0F1 ATP synthase subunit delta [Candidatus Eisenbacteria bacterium]
RSALAARTGKRVILEPRLDPRLIGGLRVQIEDEVIEHSVQKTLENLRATLQGAELGGARG